MRDEQPDRHDEGLRHANQFGGSGGDVVQARDVQGGVHFHGYVPAFSVTPRQLPGGIRGFVNRQAELAQLDDIAADHQQEPFVSAVAVIMGTAGVGKTSLALHWAHSARQRFSAGELYVNLRGYDPGLPATPEQVLDRFLRDLGVPAAIPAGLEDRASLYRSILADRRMLIVLDNAASAGQVRPLLPGTPGSLVLVTSRNRLSGLVVREGAHRLNVDMLLEADAIALLQAVTAGYRAQDRPHELAELARLCARLPLALRIAAERAASRPLMMLDELIADLRDESALWTALSAENGSKVRATCFPCQARTLTPEGRSSRLPSRTSGERSPSFRSSRNKEAIRWAYAQASCRRGRAGNTHRADRGLLAAIQNVPDARGTRRRDRHKTRRACLSHPDPRRSAYENRAA
jgi:hypothetical protein